MRCGGTGRSSPGLRALRLGRWSEMGRPYFVTTTVRGKQSILVGDAAAHTVRSLYHYQDLGVLHMLAYVIMPEHVHILAVLGESISLQSAIGQWKGSTAREINSLLGKKGPLWQAGFYDHGVRRDEDLRQVATYIEGNPVRRGLVLGITDYPFSSAGDEARERMRGWQAIW